MSPICLIASLFVISGPALAQADDGSVRAPYGPGALDPPSSSLGFGEAHDLPPTLDDAAPSGPERQSIDRNRVYVTPHAGGTWIRGRTYKARVAADGFRYVPFLGSKAKQNWPLDLRLRSAAIGEHQLELTGEGTVTAAGQRFDIERGAVTVRYDADVDSVEQTFVVKSPHFHADVTLELDLETELVVTRSEDGWVFASERGGVHVGKAIALDGDRVLGSVQVRCSGDTMRLTVPANLVSRVTDELIIDPVFSTFTVDDYLTEERNVDVAYARLRDQFTFVWEDYFSTADIDVFQAGYDTAGVLLSLGYVDSGDRNWCRPKVASLRTQDRWLVVAERSGTGGLGNDVVGRLLSGAGMGVGIELTLGESTSGWSNHAPDVGGSWSTDANSRFLVVWERQFATDRHIRFRLVDFNNNLSGVRNAGSLSNASHTRVHVSQSTGDPTTINRWNVACTRSMLTGPPDYSVAGFQVNGDGTIPFGQSLNSLASTPTNFFTQCYDVSDSILGPDGVPTYVILRPVHINDSGNIEDAVQALLCQGQQVVRRQLTTGLHPDGGYWSFARVAATRTRFLMVHNKRGEPLWDDCTTSVWDFVPGGGIAMASERARIELPAPYAEVYDRPSIATRYSGGLWSEISGIGLSARESLGSVPDIVAALHSASAPRGFARLRRCGAREDFGGREPTLYLTGGSSLAVQKTAWLYELPPGAMVILYASPVAAGSIRLEVCSRPTCIAADSGRLIGAADAMNGTAQFAIDPSSMPSRGAPMTAMAGQTWGFQGIYTDPDGMLGCAQAVTNGAFGTFE